MAFSEMQQTVATFYQFVELPDFEVFGERLKTRCEESKVLGTVILATEGINATVAGPKKGIDEVMIFLFVLNTFRDFNIAKFRQPLRRTRC